MCVRRTNCKPASDHLIIYPGFITCYQTEAADKICNPVDDSDESLKLAGQSA